MDDSDKIHAVADDIAGKVKEIQCSILQLLAKLEMQEKLDWPNMLESFSVLSGQFNSLMQLLQSSPQSRGGVVVKKLAVVPKYLSIDVDPRLQRSTEGRVSSWSHAVAPDYLRTKAEESMEAPANLLFEKAHKMNVDLIHKHMTAMGKQLDTVLNCLNELSEKHKAHHNSHPCSYSDEDTMALVLAVTRGDGLQPKPRRINQANNPPPQPKMQPSSIRSQLQAGLQMPPQQTQQPR